MFSDAIQNILFQSFDIESPHPLEGTVPKGDLILIENVHPIIKFLIYSTGVYYPIVFQGPVFLVYIFQWIYNIFQFLSLIGSMYFGLNIFIQSAFLYNSSMTFHNDTIRKTIISNILFGLIFFLQSFALLPSFWYINKRFYSPLTHEELSYYHIYSYPTIISILYLIILMILSVIIPAEALVPIGSTYSLNVYYIIMEYTIVLLMFINLYFLLVDIHISIQKIDDLKILYLSYFSNPSGTSEGIGGMEIYDAYNNVSSKVKITLEKTFWQITLILVICVFNIIFIVYNTYQTPYPSIYAEISINCLFIKEIPFIFIIMYYSAIINEKAEDITTYLLENNYKKVSHYSILTYNLARDSPISMKIFGYTLYRKTVFVNWLSFAITILIGIIKSKIFNGNIA